MRKISYILLIAIFICNCDDKDFEIPIAEEIKVPEGIQLTIPSILSGLDRNDTEKVVTFSEDNQFLDGYVVSTDKSGNFFKEIIIQDQPKNPTKGLSILIDERALYQRFPLGSKIRIKLKELSLGFKNGVPKLGKLKKGAIEPIDFVSVEKYIFRTGEIVELTPLKIKLEELTYEQLMLYLTLDNLQFDKNFLEPTPKTFSGELTDRFDGIRAMNNCKTGLEIALSTSTFSSFKSVVLPTNSGSISGILSRDFSDDFFVLKLNQIEDLNFDKEPQCNSSFFKCDVIDSNFTELIFEENFEAITNEKKLEPLGWFNINTTGDEKRWVDKKVTNIDNRTISISAFNTNLRPLEAWLITPEINLSDIEKAILRFKVRTRFNNGKALRVFVTNNYFGDPLTTLWEELPVEIPLKTSNFKTIIQNISCLEGNVRIGFKYRGFDPLVTSTYEIDDVQVYIE